MRIIVDRALFDTQSEAEATALINLLGTAVNDVHPHAFLTTPLYDPSGDNQELDTWFSNRPRFEADAFRRLLRNGVLTAASLRSTPVSGPCVSLALEATQPRTWHLPGTLEIRVERRLTSDWRRRLLTLADAADLLREPVHLVMENARTDFSFLVHLAGPTNGATLRALESKPGKIEKHGGGGGEAKKWLEALTDGTQTKDKWRRMLRAWVLFDQDAGSLDVRDPSPSAVELMKTCEEVVSAFGNGLSWICLRRREIESYVPDSGLRTQRIDKKTFIEQIIDWRNDASLRSWAWALDLKKGLHGDRHPAWNVGLPESDANAVKRGKKPLTAQMLKAPFSTLSPQDITTLERGFGDALGDSMRAEIAPAWTSDIPAEYDRGPLEQAPRLTFVQSIFDRI